MTDRREKNAPAAEESGPGRQVICDDGPKRTRRRRACKNIAPTVEELARVEVAHRLAVLTEPQWESPRQRAAQVRRRMAAFHAVYNAAWHVRAAYFGRPEARQRRVLALADAVRHELAATDDPEALLYAIADALTNSPHGVPWEA